MNTLSRRGALPRALDPSANYTVKPDRRSRESSQRLAEGGFHSVLFEWLTGRRASKGGTALANRITRQSGPHLAPDAKELRRRLDREVRAEQLNFVKRAVFATSFKYRLLERGVSADLAAELTLRLVTRCTLNTSESDGADDPAGAPAHGLPSATPAQLLECGDQCVARGADTEAISHYQDVLRHVPGHGEALNRLAAAYCRLGLYYEAKDCFRQAISVKPGSPEAHCNLGTVLQWLGEFDEAEASLRQALQIKPHFVTARVALGFTLLHLARLGEATSHFRKALKATPGHAEALIGVGQIARLEGRFERAEHLFRSALRAKPRMRGALAALAGIRTMTVADGEWLADAQHIAASGLPPVEEAEIRFAIGKYYDDVREYDQAFQSYHRANELLKTLAERYDRDARARSVDATIGMYTRDALATEPAGASASDKPVFIVGMMRSGTSLAEQIIASHPAAKGMGESAFWSNAASAGSEGVRRELAASYLQQLIRYGGDALRIVDKTPVNADHLGMIHSVFPHARIIHMQRDPVDTCLSCYFQLFPPVHNFTLDLSDLAHYYREYRRLMAHWHAVLPPASILEVPYAELVADPGVWTRRMLEFLGLEWDERCLSPHKTVRPVVTASAWQVRQRIYQTSVARWRHYEKFIEPLMSLKT